MSTIYEGVTDEIKWTNRYANMDPITADIQSTYEQTFYRIETLDERFFSVYAYSLYQFINEYLEIQMGFGCDARFGIELSASEPREDGSYSIPINFNFKKTIIVEHNGLKRLFMIRNIRGIEVNINVPYLYLTEMRYDKASQLGYKEKIKEALDKLLFEAL